jgi:hypothetical protein
VGSAAVGPRNFLLLQVPDVYIIRGFAETSENSRQNRQVLIRTLYLVQVTVQFLGHGCFLTESEHTYLPTLVTTTPKYNSHHGMSESPVKSAITCVEPHTRLRHHKMVECSEICEYHCSKWTWNTFGQIIVIYWALSDRTGA